MKFPITFFSFFFLIGEYSLHAFPWDLQSIQNHIDQQFLFAKVELDPFPHLIVESILPDDLYNELCDQWPNKSFKGGIGQTGGAIRVGDFKGQTQNTAQAKQIWTEFSTLIFDQMIKKKVAELLRPYAYCRFGQQINGLSLCNSTDVGEHRLAQNHQISPHVDQAYTFAPLIIYFSRLEEHANIELGTQFYRHNKNRTSVDVCFDNDVTLVKTVSYKPNTLCSFMQTPYSWHAAKHRSQTAERKLYFSNIYLSSQFMQSYYGTTFKLDPNFLNSNETY